MRLKRTLVSALVGFTCLAGTGAAMAGAAVSGEQIAVTTPPAGSAAWTHDTSLGRPLPDPATATPAQVAAFFAALGTTEQHRLADRYPLVVGNLDGAPLQLRYRANRLALRQQLDAVGPDDARSGQLEALLAPGVQVLAFDPRSRGLVAEVYGDLATADRVAVLVPGSDTDLEHFDKTDTAARNLRAEEAAQDPGARTAVLAWADYVTPVGLGADAATARLAAAASPRLARLLGGLALTTSPAAHTTLLCHSYGSVVCGMAAPGLRPGPNGAPLDLVVLGSPGMDVDDAADLGDGVRLWATERNPSDWIGDVPYLEIGGVGHGADPTASGFGSHVIASTGASGHNGYFAPGTTSLTNFAAIALGRYRTVHCAPDDPTCTEL